MGHPRSAELRGLDGSLTDLLDCADDHRRGTPDLHVRCRLELGAQGIGESAFAGFDDRTGMMGDQPAQHGIGVPGVAQVPGAIELVQAGGGEAGA